MTLALRLCAQSTGGFAAPTACLHALLLCSFVDMSPAELERVPMQHIYHYYFIIHLI